MQKPVCPCKRPEGLCQLRTTTCKFDGTCPHGYEEYQKDVERYRDLVTQGRMADGFELACYVRRKREAEKRR